MNYMDTLGLLEEFESKMGVMYAAFAIHFSSNTEAGTIFEAISSEEIHHRDIVRYERRIMLNHEKGNEDASASIDTNLIKDFIQYLDDTIAKADHLTLEESLRLAISLENSGCERLYNVIAEQIDPEFSKLVTAMNHGCKSHMKRLKEFEAELLTA